MTRLIVSSKASEYGLYGAAAPLPALLTTHKTARKRQAGRARLTRDAALATVPRG